MAILKTWDIEKVVVIKNLFGFEDVVNRIHYKLKVENEGDGLPPLSTVHNGWINLNLPDTSSSYVNYADLSKETLVAWVKDALGSVKVQEIEKQMEWHFIGIMNENKPELVQLEEAPLPWAPVTDSSVPDLSGNSGTTDNTGSSGYSGS